MKQKGNGFKAFPSAHRDAANAKRGAESAQTRAAAYKLAFQDEEFMLREELRPVRLQLELLKPEMVQQEEDITSTVVIYGSARIPDPEAAAARCADAREAVAKRPGDSRAAQALSRAEHMLRLSRYYDEARKLAALISEHGQRPGKLSHVVATGGGPGIMEAANRGAFEAGAKSIGLNIVLPHEQAPNPYITPELCFQFHYFAIRKMHFLIRAKALVAFPGGYGTLDELFEVLTLVQTGKMQPIPILLFGREFWERVINFDALVEAGTIASEDTRLFRFVETAEEAWQAIASANGLAAN